MKNGLVRFAYSKYVQKIPEHNLLEYYKQNQSELKSNQNYYGRAIKGVSTLALSFLMIGLCVAAEHKITLEAKATSNDDGLGNKLYAYRMVKHKVDGKDITDRYSNKATIPGPTIVINEGDTVEITLTNDLPDVFPHTHSQPIAEHSEQVSVHVHGVHYDIESDGTLKVINKLADEGAGIGPDDGFVQHYSYTWFAAPGTAGTWPYHDHNLMTHNGAEQKGLYGAIIVNPAGGSSYAKEYVLYVTDDAFWGMEIDGATGKQTKHGTNPTLSAANGANVRFHLISLGTDIHTFKLNGYSWKDPGTDNDITEVAIGPLEKHVFSVTANGSTTYSDQNFTNYLMGMRGQFNVE